MERLLSILLCSLLYCLACIGQQQTYITKIQHLSIADGLSDRRVHAIFQDSRGFIWAATQYGLNRFDGTTFRTFSHETHGLYSNMVHQIHEDKHGFLWLTYAIVHEDHPQLFIEILDPIQEKISSIDTLLDDPPSFKLDDVIYTAQGEASDILLLTAKGTLLKYDGEFEIIFQSDQEYWQVLQKSNEYWLAKDKTVTRVSQDGKVLDTIRLADYFFRLQSGGTDNLWIATSPGQYLDMVKDLYAIGGDTLTAIEISKSQAQIISQKGAEFIGVQNGFWFGNSRALTFFSQDEFSYDLYTQLKNHNSDLQIFALFFSSDDLFWVGTNDGLFKVSFRRNRFVNYLHDTKAMTSVRGMLVTDQELYALTYQGPKIIDVKTGSFRDWPNAPFTGYGISKDHENNIWTAGGENYDFWKLNNLTAKPEIYSNPQFADKGLYVTKFLHEDRNRKKWVGTSKGLHFIDEQLQLIKPFIGQKKDSLLSTCPVNHIYENDEGLWLATGCGILLLDWQGNVKSSFPSIGRTSVKSALHLHEDQEGYFWLACGGGGLIRWRPLTSEVHQFNINEGLSHNFINAVFEDRFGQLWLPSNYGLMRFDKQTHAVITYLPQDGIAHEEFNRYAFEEGPEGRLYFGGLGGITALDPRDFQDTISSQIPLQLIGCQVQKKDGSLADKTWDILRSDSIVLHPGDKSFTIMFSLLDYRDPEAHRYAYQIEGIDKSWNLLRDNSLRVNALPFGNFTLRVRGKSSGGRWSERELAIPITVQRPLYLKPWFHVALLTILLVLARMIWKKRIAKLKRKQNELEEEIGKRTAHLEIANTKIREDKELIEKQSDDLRRLDRLKTEFFTNVAHELRTPLTLVLGPLTEVLKNRTLDDTTHRHLNLMRRNGKKLQTLVEEILDFNRMKESQLQLTESPVSLLHFVRRVFSTFESYALHQQIKLQLEFLVPHTLQLLTDAKKLESILNNLVQNAIKYTREKGEVRLTVTEVKNQLKFTVSDTGRGIHSEDLPNVFSRFAQATKSGPNAHGGTGIGLALCNEYARLLGGDITVESTLGVGSKFILTIPRKEALAKKNIEFERSKARVPINFSNGTSKGHPSILLVEDNPDMQRYLQEVLGDHFNIIPAYNGLNAIEMLKHEMRDSQVDCIISDVMMPAMDGIELLQWLKESKQWGHIPFILLTARTGISDRITALRIGVDDYITKPFQVEELLARVRNLLQNYRARVEWHNKHKNGETYHSDWLTQVEETALTSLGDPAFSVNFLATKMHLSERQFYRRMKASSGLTPNQYLREVRLQYARRLIEDSTVSNYVEVSRTVGFSTPAYFAKLYQERFGRVLRL